PRRPTPEAPAGTAARRCPPTTPPSIRTPSPAARSSASPSTSAATPTSTSNARPRPCSRGSRDAGPSLGRPRPVTLAGVLLTTYPPGWVKRPALQPGIVGADAHGAKGAEHESAQGRGFPAQVVAVRARQGARASNPH